MACDSQSSFPPVCCVHDNGANGQVLGHHRHQEQEESLPEYQINFNDETKQGVLPLIAAQQAKTNSKAARRTKAKRLVLATIAISGFLYLAITHLVAFLKKDDFMLPMMDPSEEDCRIRTIDYDGPSKFDVNVKNLQLYLGPGNFKTKVNVFSESEIETAQIHLRGTVSPDLFAKKKKAKSDYDVDIEHQFVNIKIKEDGDLLDASIWYQDHETEDEWEHPYKACAYLEIDVVIPEGTQFGSLSIDGNVVQIDTHSLGSVGFEEIYFGTKVGAVLTKDLLRTNSLEIDVNTGKVTVESVKVATLGKPLDITAVSKTGFVIVNALTNYIDQNESQDQHVIKAKTTTGGVQIGVQPDGEGHGASSVSGNILIVGETRTGSVKAQIELADEDQHLELKGETKTGSIFTRISDTYSGHFGLKTRTGTIHVSQNPSSTSRIEYEVNQKKVKEGVKTTADGEKVSQGDVSLSSSSGSVSLLFFERV
ncbi:hypothetical protein BGW38_004258 [Lunasporangiospora selenospora]|uniref:DUF7330 domain-containing protein n=1 Tax=Lunasporangiospora selenospora TaxID=979761 RepID=A0A9P6FPI3_9FUNG|nr:hypothetical protein BGW38_004258 [Lunasporangiospora selenospora]